MRYINLSICICIVYDYNLLITALLHPSLAERGLLLAMVKSQCLLAGQNCNYFCVYLYVLYNAIV